MRTPIDGRLLAQAQRATVDDVEAAIDAAVRVPTQSLDAPGGRARSLQCGMITINDAPAHGVGHFPFRWRQA